MYRRKQDPLIALAREYFDSNGTTKSYEFIDWVKKIIERGRLVDSRDDLVKDCSDREFVDKHFTDCGLEELQLSIINFGNHLNRIVQNPTGARPRSGRTIGRM